MHLLNEKIEKVSAFAPATVANVVVGFDILGFSFDLLGDRVTLIRRNDSKIKVESILAEENLPKARLKNTASVAVEAFCRHCNINPGFSIHIKKGIPLCSGMGGSAASAVAAVVACNQFLKEPLPMPALINFALAGEKAASLEAHADNIVPALFGGLTLIQAMNPFSVLQLPNLPIYCVLIHPHLKVATRDARKILSNQIPMALYVKQSANLAAFIAALYKNDLVLVKQSLHDCIIEPQRAALIPDFYKLKKAAMGAQALSFSFSGSGPTVFSFAASLDEAKQIAMAVQAVFNKRSIASDYWISALNQKGAQYEISQ